MCFFCTENGQAEKNFRDFGPNWPFFMAKVLDCTRHTLAFGLELRKNLGRNPKSVSVPRLDSHSWNTKCTVRQQSTINISWWWLTCLYLKIWCIKIFWDWFFPKFTAFFHLKRHRPRHRPRPISRFFRAQGQRWAAHGALPRPGGPGSSCYLMLWTCWSSVPTVIPMNNYDYPLVN